MEIHHWRFEPHRNVGMTLWSTLTALDDQQPRRQVVHKRWDRFLLAVHTGNRSPGRILKTCKRAPFVNDAAIFSNRGLRRKECESKDENEATSFHVMPPAVSSLDAGRRMA